MTTTQNILNATRIIFTAALIAAPSITRAQTVRINIGNAPFTRPLVEKLAGEYQKLNPSFKAEIVNSTDEADARVDITTTDNTNTNSLARYFILPIANSDNAILGEKKVQKGLNEKVTKEIFVERSFDDIIDSPDKKQLPGTVYSLSGKHAATTALLANSLDVDVKNIRGKKVIGREENVITVVKNRHDAIAVDVANLVYDNTTRKPVSGLTVLPIDLDGNGKVTDDERAALTSIDSLTDFISNQGKTSLPTGNVSISSQNKDADAFIVWATTAGQDYVNTLGYLKNNTQNVAMK